MHITTCAGRRTYPICVQVVLIVEQGLGQCTSFGWGETSGDTITATATGSTVRWTLNLPPRFLLFPAVKRRDEFTDLIDDYSLQFFVDALG